MDEIGPLRAKIERLRRKARYYDSVRLTLHLEAVLSVIGELEERVAELERHPGRPVAADPVPAVVRPPDVHPPPPPDPAEACGFT